MQGWAAHMYFFFITNMLFQGTTETVHKYVMTVCEALAPVKDMRQGLVESFLADLITVRENSNVNLMAPNSSAHAIFHHNLEAAVSAVQSGRRRYRLRHCTSGSGSVGMHMTGVSSFLVLLVLAH
jgi:hypothetical protein